MEDKKDSLEIGAELILKGQTERNVKYTIGIPTFKRAALLKIALQSAINQDVDLDYNILVVDNDSTRGCETELLLTSLNCPFLTYYKNNENLGMTGNWNQLYRLASGEYVIMLHDDDLLLPHYLKLLDKFIKASGFTYDLILQSFHIDNKKIVSEDLTPFNGVYSIKSLDIKPTDFLWGNICGAPVGMCLRKSKINSIGWFDPSFYPSSDYEFYIRASSCAKVVKLFGKPTCVYTINENDSSKNEVILGFIATDLKLKDKLIEQHFSFFFKRIKRIYNEMYAFEFLKSTAYYFDNKTIDIAKEAKSLGITIGFFHKITYAVLDKIRKYNFSLRKKKWILGTN